MTHYMPSNGTEGCAFESRFCDRCQKDVPPDPEGGRDTGECEIHTNALCGIQPPEWIEDQDGPRCTAFQPITTEPQPEPDIPGQQYLFDKGTLT